MDLNASDYRLIVTMEAHIEALMDWHRLKHNPALWSGPYVRPTKNIEQFKKDFRFEAVSSYSMVDQQHKLVGFGQFYVKRDRCHFGRLIVRQKKRGQGLGRLLVDLLEKKATFNTGLTSYSLFINAKNKNAIAFFEKVGYQKREYPKLIPFVDNVYMVKN